MYQPSRKSKESKATKCYFTQLVTEPSEADAKPQMSKLPYSLIQSSPWGHTVDLALPVELYHIVEQNLKSSDLGVLRYSRVFMSLLDILSGDFFTQYIKTGNILLRSSGRHLVDNIYYLHTGILHLELDRATYERCGLVGEAIPDGGRKHAKQRFLVKVNLRLPNMLHGKKGFERLLKAAKEVLIGDEEWLFADLSPRNEERERPIDKFHPTHYEVNPVASKLEHKQLPWLPNDGTVVELEYAEEILEWLGLVWMDSPRIARDDDVDAFFCRYQLPHRQHMPDASGDDRLMQAPTVVRMRWHGLAHQAFIRDVFLVAKRALVQQPSWFAVNVCGFERQSYSIMGLGDKHWLCWQCED